MPDKPEKKSRFRWLFLVLRWGLCAAAVVFLAYTVKWHDRVELQDGTKVRLLEQRDDGFLVVQDGEETLISPDEVNYQQVDGRDIPVILLGVRSVVLKLNKPLALLALLMFAPVWFLQSYRLVLMVAIQGLRLAYWNALKLTFAGNFFNFALPGTTGGDLVKAYYISYYTHDKTEVVTTIFLDRAIGLLSVVLLATGPLLLYWDPEKFGYLAVALTIIFACLAAGGVVIFSGRIRKALRLSELVGKLPMGQQLLRIGRATVALRHHPWHVAGALTLSLVLQAVVVLSAFVLARALHMHGDLLTYFVYVAIGFLIAAIPSSPQAIGVMEAAYVHFFTQSGLNTASQAVALALGVRLVQLVWALPGVLVPIFGAHLPSKAELAALEQQASEQQAAKAKTAPDSPDVPADGETAPAASGQ